MEESVFILLAGFWIGLSKGGVAGPIGGALLLPLLSQTMPVKDAVGLILPLLMFADLFAMRFYWKLWDMRLIWLTVPAGAVGVAFGAALLSALSDDSLRRLLGLITLGIIAYKLSSDALKNVEYKHHNWHGYLAGWTSGFMSALANAGGPPVTAYLLLNKVKPAAFVGTVTLYFFVINWLKLPFYLREEVIDLDQLISIAWMLPIIPVGVWVGRKIITWINPVLFERLMMVLLFFSALILLFDIQF